MKNRNSSTIIPSFTSETSDPDLDRLLSPARFYEHPNDVLADPTLELAEKRAILSSWVSDACAVESMPSLRKPPGMPAPIPFDVIMDALHRLDSENLRASGSNGDRKRGPGSPALDA
ncbi:hypothetical protein [Zhengella mangrovi]|uniref:hypothetical protein n=1 Tax=Zhengella mangrovi TaxID=1982044 RepID=UPI001FE03FAD|nr:hypothetical protein [Zhengella mangrovi]